MKTITFILAILLLSLHSFGQLSETIGFSGGISISNVLQDPIITNPTESRIGHLYRISYEVDITKDVFFSTGVLFWEKGFKSNFKIQNLESKADVTHRYLILPVGIGFQAGGTIYMKAALQLHFGLMAQHEVNTYLIQTGLPDEEYAFYQTSDYTGFDLSIVPLLKIGYRANSKIGIFIQGMASLSLTKISNKKLPNSGNMTNYSIGANIGLDYAL